MKSTTIRKNDPILLAKQHVDQAYGIINAVRYDTTRTEAARRCADEMVDDLIEEAGLIENILIADQPEQEAEGDGVTSEAAEGDEPRDIFIDPELHGTPVRPGMLVHACEMGKSGRQTYGVVVSVAADGVFVRATRADDGLEIGDIFGTTFDGVSIIPAGGEAVAEPNEPEADAD